MSCQTMDLRSELRFPHSSFDLISGHFLSAWLTEEHFYQEVVKAPNVCSFFSFIGILIDKRWFTDDSVRRREMERVPCDDTLDEARGDGVLEHLCHSLQLLASPTQAQISHFPVGWVVLTDE